MPIHFALRSLLLSQKLLKTCTVLCLFAMLTACGGKHIDDIAWRGQVQDLNKFPQDLTVYAKPAGGNNLLISQAIQAEKVSRYKTLYFKPWSLTKSSLSKKDAKWAPNHYKGKSSYTLSGGRVGPETWNEITNNANIGHFPSLAWKGIITSNAPLRALPTNTAFYLNPAKPGEGYPFDYLQYLPLWIGTPVFVSHISKDRNWLFCETAVISGWVPANAVSPVTNDFINRWQNMQLGAVIDDNLSTTAKAQNADKSSSLRIGTLLPLQNGNLLVPVAQGAATTWQTVAVSEKAVKPFPLPATANNIAMVGNQMMGEPYGWGGLDFHRDCSSMTRDLFTPFGLWLPRNSNAQLKIGRAMDISHFDAKGKERVIRDFGEPFLTLVGFPGHVMLYIGQYDGQAAIFHDIWGTHTALKNGQKGRLVIGKVVVTSTEPGKEYQEVQNASTLINRIKSIAVLQ